MTFPKAVEDSLAELKLLTILVPCLDLGCQAVAKVLVTTDGCILWSPQHWRRQE